MVGIRNFFRGKVMGILEKPGAFTPPSKKEKLLTPYIIKTGIINFTILKGGGESLLILYKSVKQKKLNLL